MAMEVVLGFWPLNCAVFDAESVYGQAAAWLTCGDSPPRNELHRSVGMLGEVSRFNILNKLGITDSGKLEGVRGTLSAMISPLANLSLYYSLAT